MFPTREDIWGLVINEALAYGLPIITTDKCNAGLELVSDNGVIVPVDDSDKIAKEIYRLMEEENLINMSKKSVEKAHCYTLEAMAMRNMEIFKEVCSIARN